MKGYAPPIIVWLACLAGCGPGALPKTAVVGGRNPLLPDVRQLKDRPPVVIVAREGDPAGALAVAVTTAGVMGTKDGAEVAPALAGVVEARLASRGLSPVVSPSSSGYRVTVLVGDTAIAERTAAIVRSALVDPIDDRDLPPARKKLAALADRPLPYEALESYARCVGSLYAPPDRIGKARSLDTVTLERWRAGAHGLGRVAVSITAPAATTEAVARAIGKLPPWKASAQAFPQPPATGAIEIYERVKEPRENTAVLHGTYFFPTASSAVTAAGALGDPHGPLPSRLAALRTPFRLREVTASAEPQGGCIGFVLESTANVSATSELAEPAAQAIALVRAEAVASGAGDSTTGRALAKKSGDAQEAAERAAWWALADSADAGSTNTSGGSVALGLPWRRAGISADEAHLEPSREVLAAALQRAESASKASVAEERTRFEPGQGEAWVLLASPCGSIGETDTTAGATALFATAVAAMAREASDVAVEPWSVPDGAGLLVHGSARPGESSSVHVQRLADIASRHLLAAVPTPVAIAHARGELLRRDARVDGPVVRAVAAAVAPGRPSSMLAAGPEEALLPMSDATVLARGEAIRRGPFRVAVLANAAVSQGKDAHRAVERWFPREDGASRSCSEAPVVQAARAGTYSIEPRPGAAPEAYLAFPLGRGDERERVSATLLAAALDGSGGLLERAMASNDLARSWSARVIGWPSAPALVVRLTSSQANLDGSVMQARALFDRLRRGGLTAADYARAVTKVDRDAVAAALDPRFRVVATWRGEPIPTAREPMPRGRATVEDMRTFTEKRLAEESLVIVASRPGANLTQK